MGRMVGVSGCRLPPVHTCIRSSIPSRYKCAYLSDHNGPQGCSVRHLPFMASFIRFATMRFGVGDDVDTRTTGRATTAP